MSNTHNHNSINQSPEQMAAHQLVALFSLQRIMKAVPKADNGLLYQYPHLLDHVSSETRAPETTPTIETQPTPASLVQLAGDQAVNHSTSYPWAA